VELRGIYLINTLDIIFLSIISLTTLLGLWKGLTRQFFGIGGVAAGYIASMKLYEPAARLFTNSDSGVARIISFISIFLLCKLVVSHGAWAIRRIFRRFSLGKVSRAGGASLGFLKGLIIVIILTLVLLAFIPADSSLLTESATLPYLASLPKISMSVVPEKIRDRYNDSVDKLRVRWEKREKG